MFRVAHRSSSGALNCMSVYIYGLFGVYKFDIHGSMHCRLLNRNTNKMQLCNRIYYSIVY